MSTLVRFARILCGAIALASYCTPSTAQGDGKFRNGWEQVMARSAVLGLQLEAHRLLAAGKVGRPFADCVDVITPEQFAGDFTIIMQRVLTPEEIRTIEQFWESDVGRKATDVMLMESYRHYGIVPPNAPAPLSALDQQVLELQGRSLAAQKLATEAETWPRGVPPAVTLRAKALLSGCRAAGN